jgi:type VI secretion system secreted protein Hcp
MKLDPIPGDCKIPALKDYLTVNSVSWELTREFSDSGKMGTADLNVGTTDMPPITVGKSMDIGSCDLMQNAISGKSMGTAEIKFLMQQGTDQKEPLTFLEFKLNNALVASWSIDGSEDDRPSENVTLWYHKIWMQYTPFDGGKAGTKIARGWDRIENAAWNGK